MIVPLHEPPPYLLLDNVSWETYEGLLRDLEGQHRRITYDQESLEIMTVSHEHEFSGELLGDFVRMLTLELNINSQRRVHHVQAKNTCQGPGAGQVLLDSKRAAHAWEEDVRHRRRSAA